MSIWNWVVNLPSYFASAMDWLTNDLVLKYGVFDAGTWDAPITLMGTGLVGLIGVIVVLRIKGLLFV